jgi:hypothetical protein
VVRSPEERVAAVVMEIPEHPAAATERAECILAAMQELRRGGFALVLVPAGTSVRLKRSRPRHRWRGPRAKGAGRWRTA